MPEINEQRLVERAQSEPQAFAALYDHYMARIFKYVYRRQKFLLPLKWLGWTEGRGAETAVAQREQQSHLHDALAQLSDKDRDIISLRYFEELSSEEVAEILGCSTQNVYLRLHRALGRLRQQLEIRGDWRLETGDY